MLLSIYMYVYVYFYPGLSQPVKGPRGGGPGGGEAGPGDPDPCNAREDGGRQCESIYAYIHIILTVFIHSHLGLLGIV